MKLTFATKVTWLQSVDEWVYTTDCFCHQHSGSVHDYFRPPLSILALVPVGCALSSGPRTFRTEWLQLRLVLHRLSLSPWSPHCHTVHTECLHTATLSTLSVFKRLTISRVTDGTNDSIFTSPVTRVDRSKFSVEPQTLNGGSCSWTRVPCHVFFFSFFFLHFFSGFF